MTAYFFKSLFLFYLFTSTLTLAQDIQLSVQTGHSGPVKHLKFSPDNKILASAGTDNNVVLWDVLSGKQMAILSGHTNEINAVVFHPNNQLLISASKDGTCRLWKIPEGKEIEVINFSEEVGAVEISDDGKILWAGSSKLIAVDMEKMQQRTLAGTSGKLITSLQLGANGQSLAVGGKNRKTKVLNIPDGAMLYQSSIKAHDLAFSEDGEFLHGGSPYGKIFRRSIGDAKGKEITITANRIWKDFYSVDVGARYFAGANKDGYITLFDLKKNKIVHNLKGHKGAVNALSVDQSGRYLATAGRDQVILLWDVNTGRIAQRLMGIGSRINDVSFTEEGDHIVIAYNDGSFRKCALYPGGEIKYGALKPSGFKKLIGEIFPWEHTIDSIKSTEKNKIVFYGSRRLRDLKRDSFKKSQYMEVIWEPETGRVISEVITKNKSPLPAKPSYSPNDTHKAISATVEGKILNLSGQDNHRIITSHTDMITSVDINPQHPLVATGSWDGTVRIWNHNTGEEVTAFSAIGDEDYIYVDPDNYYFASKGALQGIGFLYQGKIFSFGQFDLIYNRPDLVFNNFPYIDQNLIKNYEYAYKKRLDKLGVDNAELTLSQNTPQVNFELQNSSITTSKEDLEITIEARDSQQKLDKLFIEVNGVPELGRDGMDITGHKWYGNLSLKLSAGINEVQLYVINDKGIASFKESFQINYSTQKKKPDLYLVTIGVSEYQQSDYNLTYAAKDAKDIAQYFSKNKLFNETHIKSLLNEEVVLSNIKSLKSFVGQADVDDVVIVSVAGHGVLDKNLDYYLATYDMDFGNPAEKGLSYDSLENILSVTPSRKKTLFMDACHSGELDKEEVELAHEEKTEFGKVSFRSVGNKVVRKEAVSLQSSFELSKMLFADMRSSNGSVVISSAGGAEYAMEGAAWKNGVFTYCLLIGLAEQRADLNNDNKIMLSELQAFLFERVPNLTNGKQQPTSRVENLKNDFRIW